MKARYIRVSTGKQNTGRQKVRKSAEEELFIDKISGAIPFADRPEGGRLLELVKKHKITRVNVSAIDRLGRNTFDILKTIEAFNTEGVVLKVDNLGIESLVDGKESYVFRLIISVMASIAEMERATMLERQREGIALAKAKGVYKGRSKGSHETKEQFLSRYKEVIKSLRKGNSVRDTAKICGVSPGTVQKVRRTIDAKP